MTKAPSHQGRGLRRSRDISGYAWIMGTMLMELFSLILILGALAVVLPMAIRVFRNRDDR